LSWWGKLLGGSFGYLLGGPLGALIGIVFGHNFDRGLVSNLRQQFEPGNQERVQTAFFTALFSVMGHLAKADGRVSESEIELARDVMQRMNLNDSMRQAAIRLFNQGKQPDFVLSDVLRQFRRECHGRRNLMRMFAEILVHAAYADGRVDVPERNVLEEVRIRHFGGGGFGQGGATRAGPSLHEAYEILGVEASASDARIKKAYRRMMNQHHPDKLVAKGLPEEMMKLATEKTQEIKQAYEMIKKDREKKGAA